MEKNRRKHFLMIFVFFMAIICYQRTGFSQDPALLKLRELASSSSLNIGKNASPAPGGLLDNSINPDNYYIGGGDAFSVHIVELPSVEYFIVVDQNCDAVISDLGIVRLGKKNLSQAKTILCDFIRSKLKKPYEVYISLTRVKSAIITVSGEISLPGTYQLEGTNRLFDVLRISNNNILPPIKDFDYREVKCSHQDTTVFYDLLRFLFLGDNSQNPYVYPGDNITINLSTRKVYISGTVSNNSKGPIPIKPNEKANDFLSLFNFDCATDSNNILITKYNEHNQSRTIVFSLKEPADITLDDRDVIVVPPKSDYPRLQIVEVKGEINRPGKYPIQSQKTDAMTIIEQAGGPTNRGNLKRAFVVRKAKISAIEDAMMPQDNSQLGLTTVQPLTSPVVRPEVAAALSNVTISKDYSIFPLRENAREILLEPDDQLIIPKIENVVYVSGNVKMPGAYPFVEGHDPLYYIKKAGGFTSKSDKTNVFKMIQYGEVYQIKEKSLVEEGDVVVVPESQQYKYLTTVMLPIITIVLSGLSTLILFYSVLK